MSASVQRLRAGDIFGVLNGAITNTATAMSITPDTNSAGIPAVGAPYILAIIIEPGTSNEDVVWVTAATAGQTTALTILGGQEGTQLAHSSGVPYKHGPTVNDYNPTIRDAAWNRIGTANVNDDEFNEGALDPAWVAVVPSGTQSVIVGADVCSVKVKGNGGAVACAIIKPLNGFAIGNSIETAARLFTIQDYLMAGPILTDGVLTTSNCMWQMPFVFASGLPYRHLSLRHGTLSNISVVHVDLSAYGSWNGVLYQRLKWVAANSFQAFWSIDGQQWTDFAQGAFAMTMTPTYMGFGTSTWSGTSDSLASYEYFRVV